MQLLDFEDEAAYSSRGWASASYNRDRMASGLAASPKRMRGEPS
jgi:hypothetical protein